MRLSESVALWVQLDPALDEDGERLGDVIEALGRVARKRRGLALTPAPTIILEREQKPPTR